MQFSKTVNFLKFFVRRMVWAAIIILDLLRNLVVHIGRWEHLKCALWRLTSRILVWKTFCHSLLKHLFIIVMEWSFIFTLTLSLEKSDLSITVSQSAFLLVDTITRHHNIICHFVEDFLVFLINLRQVIVLSFDRNMP